MKTIGITRKQNLSRSCVDSEIQSDLNIAIKKVQTAALAMLVTELGLTFGDLPHFELRVAHIGDSIDTHRVLVMYRSRLVGTLVTFRDSELITYKFIPA